MVVPIKDQLVPTEPFDCRLRRRWGFGAGDFFLRVVDGICKNFWL